MLENWANLKILPLRAVFSKKPPASYGQRLRAWDYYQGTKLNAFFFPCASTILRPLYDHYQN